MQAALAAEPALGADETPVNVLTPDNDPQTGEPETGSPHVLVTRTPGGNLTWLRALGSRRAEAITTILGFFTGFLITDGYTAYQQRTGILMRADWKPDHPIDLADVGIKLVHPLAPVVTGRHAETLRVRPLADTGKPYESYHRAMRDLNRPRLFENRICYRLQDARFSEDGGDLSLGYMRYFDMIHVGEALAHELAPGRVPWIMGRGRGARC